MKTVKQHAALPYIVRDGRVEVLLLTSRETKRWIIPKGWPKKKMAPHELAALEAYEEAGVKGEAQDRPVGQFHYVKRLTGDKPVLCKVDVYPLLVLEQLLDWPEKSERRQKWVRPGRAARLVQEKELGWILRSFAPRGSAGPEEGTFGRLVRRLGIRFGKAARSAIKKQ